ncbi:DNA-directed RNA polymerase sigma-70 factor [Nitrospira sp. KM1]|uniref:RNA polymerase sigma factor n=1 Tax=Nitrospira sp. KM1 TaxID=1936990 RepID=UPI0013A75C68|nr:RNA polymerase sigma factor [Nitrospira sp. KM1]BCA56569.1 DNA-directed RNA polymerase sigma-70 factor [Nitrospira sp. KM1]
MTSADIEQLYREHQPTLVRWLARLVGCRETAADLAQESYLRIAGMDGLKTVDHPRAFLFRTARNLAFDHLRKTNTRSKTVEPLDDALDVPSAQPSVEQILLDRQQVDLFTKTLEALPDRCREVFILHRFHHCSYDSIARQLGISKSTVEKHMIRALQHCRKAMLEYEASSR